MTGVERWSELQPWEKAFPLRGKSLATRVPLMRDDLPVPYLVGWLILNKVGAAKVEYLTGRIVPVGDNSIGAVLDAPHRQVQKWDILLNDLRGPGWLPGPEYRARLAAAISRKEKLRKSEPWRYRREETLRDPVELAAMRAERKFQADLAARPKSFLERVAPVGTRDEALRLRARTEYQTGANHLSQAGWARLAARVQGAAHPAQTGAEDMIAFMASLREAAVQSGRSAGPDPP
jgi:hypothetical protein